MLDHSPQNCDGYSITKEGVELSPSKAFDMLYLRNRYLWEQVLDELIEIAQEKYDEHFKDSHESGEQVFLEGGVDFTAASIVIARE